MASARTAAPCEVCGQRVAHHGRKRAFVVSYTVKNTPRLVHQSCRSMWLEQRATISALWPELRPEVLSKLPPWQQQKIKDYQTTFGGDMSRGPRREHFVYAPQINDAVRAALARGERRKGFIKKLYAALQKDLPELMPTTAESGDYTDFYQLVTQAENQLRWERDRTPPTAVVASPPAPAPGSETETPSPPAVPSLDSNDLPAMAETARGLVNLALARRDRESLEFALEALAHLLKSSKPTS